jgi:hypothetical protein
MYDNNITGDVNVLYSLSNSNGGILSSFVVDTDEVICRGCTDSDDVFDDNGFGNIAPTISVPKIPPPTMASKITVASSTMQPTTLNVTTLPPTLLPVTSK